MSIQGPQIVITADTSPATRAVDKLHSHIDSTLGRAVGNTDRHLNRLLSNITRGFSSIGGIITRALSGVGGIFSALFGQRMVHQIFTTVNAFQGLQNVFNTFSQNSEESAKQMQFLTAESQRLGFEIVALGAAYQKMYAAGRITGFSAEKIQEIFTSVGEAAAVAGMDSRQMEGALRALHQMMSKGKVQAEELRGQLGEHLPGAFEIAAEAMGVTTKELDKMLSTGEVTAVQLFENFPRVLREKYGAGLSKALSLPRRELDRLKNDIQLAIKSIDSGTNALFTSVLSTLRWALSGITQFFDEGFNEALRTASYYINAIPDILRAAMNLMLSYLKPIIPAAKLAWETVANLAGKAFDWIKEKTSGVFDFIKFSFLNLPAIFAGAGRAIGITFGAVVTSITNIWSDGMTYLSSKFDHWLNNLKIGLKYVRLFFSDMMVGIVEVVDGGFQGLASKIEGMANLASYVLPDSWADSISDSADAIRKSSSGLVSSLREGNNKIYAELQDLREIRDGAAKSAEATLERLVVNQQQNFAHYQDALGKSSEIVNQQVRETAAAGKEFALEVEVALQYYEDLLIASEMENEVLTDTEKKTAQIANNIGNVGGEAEKTAKKVGKIKEEVDKIADTISNSLNSAFDKFIETGEFSFKEFLRKMSADILKVMFNEDVAKPLGKALSKALDSVFGSILGSSQDGSKGLLDRLIGSIFGGGGTTGGGGGFLSGLMGKVSSSIAGFFTSIPFFHKGGVPAYGEATGHRMVQMSNFANAPRFHGGIGPNEIPAIINKDEGVFTKGQMAQMASLKDIKNASKNTNYTEKAIPAPEVNVQAPKPINIINVTDPAQVKEYLATPDGEDTMLNFIRRNSSVIRQVIV